jgi:glycoside/pentoside/hexuronide:cation symporter, GPH family
MAQETTSDRAPARLDRIPLPQLAAYGAGGIIPIALFNIAGILVGLMGNISLGLSAFWLGAILIIPRLWDAVVDPIIGHLSDNTRTRWGRRRPYLLVGGLLVAFFFVVMWWIPKGDTVRGWFPSESGYQWFQLGYILVGLTLFFTSVTLFEIPHGALGAELTTDSQQRTRLFSAKSFVGNLFAMSTPWLFVLANMEVFKGPRGNEADGMRYVSLLVAAILVPLSFWWFFTLREPGFEKAARQEATPFWQNMKRTVRNRNFMMLTLTIFTLAMGFNFVQLLGSYIPIFYVFGGDKAAGASLLGINGTVWAVTGLLAVFPLNWLNPRLGNRNTLVVAILLITLGQIAKVVCYNPSQPYLLVIPTMLLSCGMLFFFTLGASMVGDICDEDELNTGFRAEGSYYSVFWWFIKMGSALASLISGALIVLTMFDESQVTKVDKLQGDVRDMRAKVEAFRAPESPAGSGAASVGAANALLAEASADSTEYLALLAKESARVVDSGTKPPAAVERERREAIAQSTTAMRSVAAELEQSKLRLSALGSGADSIQVAAEVEQIERLTLRAKLERAKLNASELRAYFETKALATPKSSEHYGALARTTEDVGRALSSMSAAQPLDSLDTQLATVQAALVPLTKQPPYTLLMMRVVEIGLPLIACFFALLFVLRYALTDKRSREIKDLLARRHAEHGAAADPAIV